MTISKREFLIGAAAAPALLSPLGAAASAAQRDGQTIASSAKPISREERLQRIARAQRLMRDQGIAMVVIEPGASMTYFTGLRWWRSERPTLVLIPAEGEVGVVTPYFEEPSVRETAGVPVEVRTWHENENPFGVVAGFARDWKGAEGRIGMEETVRFFVADGVRRALPSATVVPGAPVVRACRMIKSPAELALMQTATDVTIAAYRDTFAAIEPGMPSGEVSRLMSENTRKHGGTPQFSMVLLNEASAYPHGTDQPQTVKEGGIVLMDCGCAVHDYESDVSRTFVLGEPTKKQREVWQTVKAGQELALEKAEAGTRAGDVDRAVRRYYESLGWGPGYRTPGLSHRLGHGIGMEGHEPINLVESEDTALRPGMCFSNEPGLYTFGEFGVRLEDCFTVTEDGPRLFSKLQPSITEIG
jgi:Xaa-Pro dipeptidase